VRGYYDASMGVLAGRAYGTEASGIRPSTAGEFSNPDAADDDSVLVEREASRIGA